MADVCISKPEVVIPQPPIEIFPRNLVCWCTKPEVVFSGRGRHLEKWIWRHISTMGAPIWTKFGSLMQNNMQITANWLRSKPEVEFQYGVFISKPQVLSAADGGISTKFGLLIDFDLLKAVTSTNTKPEVVFSGRGRHLEKWIWRHISTVGAPIWSKFGSLMQNNMQYGRRLYFETRNSYISAAIWDVSTKFVLLIDFDLLKAVTSRDTKPEVVFSRPGRHLEKWIWRHISAVVASIWTKFGSLLQNNVQISGK